MGSGVGGMIGVVLLGLVSLALAGVISLLQRMLCGGGNIFVCGGFWGGNLL